MTVHQTGYNFHPNDRVWYFDPVQSSFTEGSCYQVEIKIYKKPDETIERKLTYLVALDDSSVTHRLHESDLYMSTDDGLVQGPLDPIYHATYNFDPEEFVWVVDRVSNGVKYGTVYQTEIKIHKETESTSHTKILYYVSFNDGNGTVIAAAADAYETANEAWAALGIVIGPTPTATPSQPTGGNVFLVTKTNTDSIALPKGTPVYLKSDGTVARATNDITLLSFLGFIYEDSLAVGATGRIVTQGVITLDEAWSLVTQDSGLLEESSHYYVTALGKIGKTAPNTGYSKQIGLATSETELVISLMPTIKL